MFTLCLHLDHSFTETMSSSMLEFVLANVPETWEEVTYNESYILFDVQPYDEEYTEVQNLFTVHEIASIQRVQNPFQYGRFKIRQEMLSYRSDVVRTTNI